MQWKASSLFSRNKDSFHSLIVLVSAHADTGKVSLNFSSWLDDVPCACDKPPEFLECCVTQTHLDLILCFFHIFILSSESPVKQGLLGNETPPVLLGLRALKGVGQQVAVGGFLFLLQITVRDEHVNSIQERASGSDTSCFGSIHSLPYPNSCTGSQLSFSYTTPSTSLFSHLVSISNTQMAVLHSLISLTILEAAAVPSSLLHTEAHHVDSGSPN